MGGLVVPAVFAGLPFEVEILFAELDGTFPNHPANPIQPENLGDLRSRYWSAGSDIGLAFDGDADRVFLVDENAEPVSGSLTTAIVGAAMLEKYPGATILYNLICSHAVPEVITEHGGTPIRTRVGHSFIKAVMAETGAIFGGEHSGHYYFRDNFRADSGIIAALVVLEALSQGRSPLSVLRVPFERYSDSGEINTEVSEPAGAVGRGGRALPRAGRGDRRAGRADRRPRRLVVQPAALEHRAAPPAQRRGEDRARTRPPSRRGARRHPPACGEPGGMTRVVTTTKGVPNGARPATARRSRLS